MSENQSQSLNLQENLKPVLENLILESQKALGEVKSVAISQAWKLLQLAIANIIQKIENTAGDLAGKDKKETAMNMLSEFYDRVFIVIDIPFVPELAEVIIDKYVKAFLMALTGASIDAMVTTFRNVGVFPVHTNNEGTVV